MALSKLFYVNTGRDGLLDSTTSEDVDRTVIEVAKQSRVVLHFHGGLVSKQAGLDGADRLKRECYDPVPAYPVFFIWESGLLEVLRNNLAEIAGEDIFKSLLKWLLKFTVGKLEQTPGVKAASLSIPNDMDVYQELSLRDAEPFAGVTAPIGLVDLTPTEQNTFEQMLASDRDFQRSAQSIVAEMVPEIVGTGEKGAVTRIRKSVRTLMSPAVLDQLKQDIESAQKSGAKGILTTAKLIQSAAMILFRIIRRFRAGHDHGVYPTVVEEILRELYLANVGTAIWATMKNETFDTFSPARDGKVPGGAYFVRKLGEALNKDSRAEISLVGHSAGSVFINNFLSEVSTLQHDSRAQFPPDFVFKNVIFLAPACTFENFLPSITQHRFLFQNFRMFTMSDASECKDVLVPFVYTRSLLYLISGVLENSKTGTDSSDVPIVGMERFYTQTQIYSAPEIRAAREFLGTVSNSSVWAPSTTNPGPGLFSTARSHGDFDANPETLESVRAMIAS